MQKNKLTRKEEVFTIIVLLTAFIMSPLLCGTYIALGAIRLGQKGIEVPNKNGFLLSYYWLLWWPYILKNHKLK